MRIGSLFAGAGGLDMAVKEVFGGEVLWHSEIDKAASKVLAHRFPGVPNLGDISAVDWADVPAVDILCGGFPCQDVSAAGKRAGIKDGTRSGLWSVFADAIDHLRPRIVVIENVRGLLSAAAHRTEDDDEQTGDMESATAALGNGTGRPVLRAAGAVLGDLADLGYDAQWATVAAADVGAPHRRERVFILACAAGDTAGAPGWADSAAASFGGVQRELFGASSGDAADSSSCGWDEWRPESAGIVGGFDAAVSGDEPRRLTMLPTRATDGTDGPVTNCPSMQAICDGSAGRAPLLSEMAAGGMFGDEPGVALLPTPTAQCAKHGAESRFGGGNGDVSNLWQIAHLLPTPVSRDHKGRNQRDDESCLPGALSALESAEKTELWPVIRNAIGYEYGRQRSNGMTPMYADDIDLDGLANAATEAIQDLPGPLRAQGNADSIGQPPESGPGSPPLLPTPQGSDGNGGKISHPDTRRAGGHSVNLSEAVVFETNSPMSTAWGKYEPAIRRWEQIVGPAPAPTEPNKNGNPRLSAAFSEWLMGWPAGWLTDPAIGISRNDQLRIVGNGVCPQQAFAALQFLLNVAAAE